MGAVKEIAASWVARVEAEGRTSPEHDYAIAGYRVTVWTVRDGKRDDVCVSAFYDDAGEALAGAREVAASLFGESGFIVDFDDVLRGECIASVTFERWIATFWEAN